MGRGNCSKKRRRGRYFSNAERSKLEALVDDYRRRTGSIRRKFGLEACRAVLGHSMDTRITDRYSYEALEVEIAAKATPAVEALW